MAKIEFDNEWSQLVEEFNQSAGATIRRQRILKALNPQPGQRILDVGCGPGHQAFEIASAVGKTGRVDGVDVADDGIQIAQMRCSGIGNASFQIGSAFDLPFEENTFDAAMSSQVFEYLDDVYGALAEISRVLKPGGRILIHDTDWGALLWHSKDPDRMKRVLCCWDAHLADSHLPQRLGSLLADAGFRDVGIEPIVHVEGRLEPKSMSDVLITCIALYVSSQGISRTESEEWAAELRELGAKNKYFFSSNEYIFTAAKP